MTHRFFTRLVLPFAGIILVAFAFPGCMGEGIRLPKPLPLVEEDLQAKSLIPDPGKSLVYFYYGRYPAPKGTVVGLDDAAADVKKNTYLVWETDPGTHTFNVTFYKSMSKDSFKGNIETEAGQTYFYRLYMEQDSTSSNSFDVHHARFLEEKEQTGREKIGEFSLMAWFRDGETVFRREIESIPETMQANAETPATVATPEPEAVVEAAQELPSVPESEISAAESPEKMPTTVQGRYYALVVGISAYEHLDTLPNAVNDAQGVAEILREYGFKVNTLEDEKASRERILDSLEVFQRLLEPDDKFLFYYAGRGVFDDGHSAYWQPVEAQEESMTQWIPSDSITAALKHMPARQILVVADSVYSGTLARASRTDLNDDVSRRRYLEKVAEKRSRVILTGGAAHPSAEMSDSGLSLFASAFVKGLRDIDRHVFAAEELFQEQILEVVAGQSDRLPEFQAIRNSGHEGGDFLFVKK